MCESDYDGASTIGGKWGCAAAAIVGLPVFGALMFLGFYGDCFDNAQCDRGQGMRWLVVIVITVVSATSVGFLTRKLVNGWKHKGSQSPRATVHNRAFARTAVGGRITKQFPSLDIQGAHDSVASLTSLLGYSVVATGPVTHGIWLKSQDGTVRYMSAEGRELLPNFEVFTVTVATLADLHARWVAWKPAPVPDGAALLIRTMLTTRPPEPIAPSNFDPWPFDHWQTQVLRRAEFTIEEVSVGPTFGSNPNLHCAARPMNVPKAATALCEVAAGVLFSTGDGRRLLMGVDWMPNNILVTDELAKINDYLEQCEAIDVESYLGRNLPA